MIILKIRKTWVHVGSTPLGWALVVDGAAYYFLFVLAFGLELVANSSSEVGSLHLSIV
jgi:hypothetical protein